MTTAEQVAAQISAYLMTGMHHNTPEGRIAMAHIVDEAFSPPEICGLCGGPILSDDEAKAPHPIHWPGERASTTDIVHIECENEECERAHSVLTDVQRVAFLRRSLY